MKKLAASLAAILLVLGTGCASRPLDYTKLQFKKVYFPGTEKLSASESATIQAVQPSGRFDYVVIHSVDKKPLFCTVKYNQLLSSDFGSDLDESVILNRPRNIWLSPFKLTAYEHCPLPLSLPPTSFIVLVLPPGEHVLEFAFDDMGVSVGGFQSQGTTKKKVTVEAGKAYVVSLEGAKDGLFRFDIAHLPK